MTAVDNLTFHIPEGEVFGLLGWIPLVLIIGYIWTYILIIIGIRENQQMSTGRAILVVVVPLVLSLIFLAGLLAVAGSFAHALLAPLPG